MKGEAGRADDGVRSDLHVVAQGTDTGGIRIELESRVELYYGDAIREQAAAVAAELGVRNAALTIRDRGALPFAIAARVEAAVRRAGLADDVTTRAPAAPEHPPTGRDRPRRSRLYLPGNEPLMWLLSSCLPL